MIKINEMDEGIVVELFQRQGTFGNNHNNSVKVIPKIKIAEGIVIIYGNDDKIINLILKTDNWLYGKQEYLNQYLVDIRNIIIKIKDCNAK